MRRRLVLLIAASWACSLSPQPYPPDNYDAGVDASLGAIDGGNSDVKPGTDGGSNLDAMTPPSGDGGDAATDAEASDASDAETDATSDAGDAD